MSQFTVDEWGRTFCRKEEHAVCARETGFTRQRNIDCTIAIVIGQCRRTKIRWQERRTSRQNDGLRVVDVMVERRLQKQLSGLNVEVCQSSDEEINQTIAVDVDQGRIAIHQWRRKAIGKVGSRHHRVK